MSDDGISSANGSHPVSPQDMSKEVWQAWPTLFLGVAIGLMAVIGQSVVAGFFLARRIFANPEQDLFQLFEFLKTDGQVVSFSILVSTVITIGMVLLFIWLRRGAPISEYLALRPISIRTLIILVVLTAVFIILADRLTIILGKSIVPEYFVEAYRTVRYPLIFWLAVVIAAPFSEEILFRGFLLQGLQRSQIGKIGAVLVTSLIFASIHLQYDLYGIGQVFMLGLMLGAARVITGSLWSSIVIHALANVVATIQVILYLRGVIS